jgi:hypothetical protein
MKTMMLLLATVCAVALVAPLADAKKTAVATISNQAAAQGPRSPVGLRSSAYALVATPAESSALLATSSDEVAGELMWRAKAAQMQAQIERDAVRSAYWLGQRDAYLAAAELLVAVTEGQK